MVDPEKLFDKSYLFLSLSHKVDLTTKVLTVETEPTNLEQRSSTMSVRLTRKTPIKEWQMADVVDVIVETPETSTLRLAVPNPTEFIPGQYYNIRIPVEGRPRPIQRAYSIGSSPFPEFDVIDVGVKKMIGGLVSPVLVESTRVGDKLEIRGPYGAFNWTEDRGGPLLLIAAGSGVVPFMSMIRYANAKGLAIPMHLLFSSKSSQFVIYGRELAELEAETGWLKVVHTYTRDPQDRTVRFHRRIDKEMVGEVLEESQAKLAYLCGPPEVVEACEVALAELGMDPEKIFSEKYD